MMPLINTKVIQPPQPALHREAEPGKGLKAAICASDDSGSFGVSTSRSRRDHARLTAQGVLSLARRSDSQCSCVPQMARLPP